MIRDYAARPPSLAQPGARGGRNGRSGRSGRNGRGGGRVRLRGFGLVAGVLALIILVSGVGAAWGVNNGIDELERQQKKHLELVRQNRELSEERDHLLVRERIEEKAARLGLFPPAAKQFCNL